MLINAEGALKKDMHNKGRAIKTTLVRVILPAIDILLCLHLFNLASNLLIIGSYTTFLLRLTPIGSLIAERKL